MKVPGLQGLRGRRLEPAQQQRRKSSLNMRGSYGFRYDWGLGANVRSLSGARLIQSNSLGLLTMTSSDLRYIPYR